MHKDLTIEAYAASIQVQPRTVKKWARDGTAPFGVTFVTRSPERSKRKRYIVRINVPVAGQGE